MFSPRILFASIRLPLLDKQFGIKCLRLSGLLVFGLSLSVRAQTPSGTATFIDTPSGPNYDYTITLQNTGTTPIETFWFSWIPGEDFLPTSPIGTPAGPAGWASGVTHFGALDGYGIEFSTSTAPLSPGNSATFQFTSADTPAQLAGNSPHYATEPVGMSYLYSGGAFASPSSTLVVQPVPEPTSLALLIVGGMLFLRLILRSLRPENR
jgi:hypothetical protein